MNAVLFSLLSLRRRTYLIVKDHRAIGSQARYGGQCILRGRCGMGVDNGVETRSDEDTKDGRGEHDDDFLPSWRGRDKLRAQRTQRTTELTTKETKAEDDQTTDYTDFKDYTD